MRLGIRSFVLLTLFGAIPVIADDLTIVSRVTHDGGTPKTTVSYVSRDHVRMAQGDGREVIVDLNGGRMTTLDNTKKTYFVTTRQDLEQLAARMKEMMDGPEMKKGREAMKNLSAEDQKKMDAATGGLFAVDVQKLGTTRRIAGYSCENWNVNIGQLSRSEECLTSDLQYPAQAFDMYREFADAMKSMMAALGPVARSVTKMQDQLKKLRGYPLAVTTTVEILGHKSVITSEVTDVKRGPIPSNAWDIPPGYTKTDNPMLKAFDRRGRK